MSKLTSRVIPAWRAIHADLSNAAWPVHRTSGTKPQVWFGAQMDRAEQIVVPGAIDRPQNADWATVGNPGQQERFRLAIAVYADTPGQSDQQALDRLEELCDVVQTTFRSPFTGLPAGTEMHTLTPSVHKWHIAEFVPQIITLPEGFGGRADLALDIDARL